MKRLILLTGLPGVGKTTVLVRAAEALKGSGCKVGGMLSREVREHGTRVGFEIMDFATGQKGWLAHVNQPVGPLVSKYRVNLNDLNTIGATAIRNAVKEAQVVIVDEIGPMELFSSSFKEAARARSYGKGVKEVQNVLDAISFMQKRVRCLGLLGYSFGAVVASNAASQARIGGFVAMRARIPPRFMTASNKLTTSFSSNSLLRDTKISSAKKRLNMHENQSQTTAMAFPPKKLAMELNIKRDRNSNLPIGNLILRFRTLLSFTALCKLGKLGFLGSQPRAIVTNHFLIFMVLTLGALLLFFLLSSPNQNGSCNNPYDYAYDHGPNVNSKSRE